MTLTFTSRSIALRCVHGLMWPTRRSQHTDLTRFSEDESHTKFLPLVLPSMLPPGAVPDWADTHPSVARAQRCLTSVFVREPVSQQAKLYLKVNHFLFQKV